MISGSFIETTDSHSRRIVLCSAILLCVLYVLRLGPMPLYPMWNADQAVYLVTAKALSTGNGYRLICFPDEPLSTKYPIAYPLLISGVIKTLGLDATGLTAVRLISVVAAVCHFLLNFQLLRQYFSSRLALLAAIAIAVSPLTFEFAGEIMADELFGTVWTIVLLLTIKAVGSTANDKRAIGLAVALGIAAGVALLLRTIGIAIIAGMLLGLMINRRWKLCLVSGMVAGMTIFPWVLWSTLHSGGTFKSYSAENAIGILTPVNNAVTIITAALPAIVFPPLQTRAFATMATPVVQSGIKLVIGGAAAMIGLIGACSYLRKRDILVPALIPYLSIVLLWWWEPSRFLLPAYPILAIAFLGGFAIIAGAGKLSMPKRGVLSVQGLCLVTIASGLAVDSTRLNAVWRHQHWGGASEASYWKATREALEWICGNTAPGTLCVSPHPESVYLYTDRRTVELPVTVEAMEHTLSRLPVGTIVLATRRPNFFSPSQEEFAVSGISRLVRRSPGLLQRVWRSPGEQVEIYRISGRLSQAATLPPKRA